MIHWDIFIMGIGLFLLGAAAATCYWLACMRSYRDGVVNGYDRAQKENSIRDQADRMARWQTEFSIRQHADLVRGFPSAGYAERKPLGEDVGA